MTEGVQDCALERNRPDPPCMAYLSDSEPGTSYPLRFALKQSPFPLLPTMAAVNPWNIARVCFPNLESYLEVGGIILVHFTLQKKKVNVLFVRPVSK